MCYSALICERSMEVEGWNLGTTNEPQPELLFYFISFVMVSARGRWCCLSRPVALSLLMSFSDVKITTRNTYVKD